MTSEDEVSDADMNLLEQFVVALYCSTFEGDKVNDARRYLFTSNARTLDNIPPTAAALNEHVKRSTLQVRKWYNCLESTRIEPDPTQWGWIKDGEQFFPLWSRLDDISKVTQALIRCGCTKCVASRCKCKKSGLNCTELRACQAKC